MRYLVVGLCAVGMLAAEAAPAFAAWNNVFQPTLFGRFRRNQTAQSSPAVAYSVPVVAAAPTVVAAPQAAPCPSNCNTSYQQRCYYQPVTTYETKTYYEPVTSYQTSYYYEPVTSYRYSCYYDPCNCSYKQVATPVTSYQLKSSVSPVQSWVQRCAKVPVTSYQKSCYLQPQTTCCQTTTGPLIPVAASQAAPPTVSAIPSIPNPPQQQQQQQTSPPPVIQEQRSPPTNNDSYDRYYPPKSNSNTSWMPAPNSQIPAIRTAPPVRVKSPTPPPPPVRLDRIVFGNDSSVEGQIVRSDSTPRPESKVLFVSTDQPGEQRSVITNSAGRFAINLAPGGWLVYVHAADGNPIYHSRIDVTDQQTTQVRLVSR